MGDHHNHRVAGLQTEFCFMQERGWFLLLDELCFLPAPAMMDIRELESYNEDQLQVPPRSSEWSYCSSSFKIWRKQVRGSKAESVESSKMTNFEKRRMSKSRD